MHVGIRVCMRVCARVYCSLFVGSTCAHVGTHAPTNTHMQNVCVRIHVCAFTSVRACMSECVLCVHPLILVIDAYKFDISTILVWTENCMHIDAVG